MARAGQPGGRGNRNRTRFLDGIWPADGGPGRRTGRADPLGRTLTASDGPSGADPRILEALRDWRQGVAAETDKPAYTVLVDATLAGIAEQRPTSVPELARVRGIGPAKIDRYGASLLAIVRAHGSSEVVR